MKILKTLEKENSYEINIVAPGRTSDEFNIEVKKGYLVVESELKEDLFFSSFRRSFLLPDDVDIDNITANYNAGILKVDIPKIEIVKKKIEVKGD